MLSQVSLVLTEYGNKIDHSSKLVDLANQDVLNELAFVLAEDAAKVINTTIEARFNTCSIRYVATATNGSALTTDGTATATATSNLNAFHVYEIRDYLVSNERPPYTPNGDYICIGTTKALRGLRTDADWQNAALYGAVEQLYRGEIGKFNGVRFVECNHAMDNTIGSSDVAGEAYFFGANVCGEAIVHDVEVRVEVPTDLGRRRAIGWVMLAGWMLIEPNYCVKFDSA